MSNRSILPPIDTPRTTYKRLNLTDISSNFVYYSPSFKPIVSHKIIIPSCRNIFDASSY